jgi:hypothetical protein
MQGFSCLAIALCLLLINVGIDARLRRFVELSNRIIWLDFVFINRVKLNHFESVHDQLFKADSHRLNAFERKYGLGGPIPEGLTNYLDVRKKVIDTFDRYFLFSRLNTMAILVLVHQPNHFVLYSSMCILQ